MAKVAPINEFILGPAASGKTQRLIDTAARLVAEGVSPDKLCLITASQNAAVALRKRLVEADSRLAGAEVFSALALAVDLLTYAAGVTGEPVPRLLTPAEQAVMAADLGAFESRPWSLKGLTVFGNRLNALGIQDAPALPDGVTEEEFAAFQEDLFGRLVFASAILPGQALPAAASVAAQTFAYVLIDDAQLLNPDALMLGIALAGKGIYVAADPAQAYAAGCPFPNAAAISTLMAENPEFPVVTLTAPATPVAKYVCAATQAAAPEGDADEAQKTLCIKWTEPGDELSGIARYLQLLRKEDETLRPADFAVVVPNATWARNIAKALDNRLTNTTVIAGDFFAGDPRNPETAAALGSYELLTMAVRPDDLAAVRTWCGLGHATCRVAAWRQLESWAAAQQLSPIAALDQLAANKEVPFEDAADLVARYAEGRKAADLLGQLKGLSLVSRMFGQSQIDAIAAVTGRVEEDLSAEQLWERMSLRIFDPVFNDDPNCVAVCTPNRLCGMSPKAVIAMGAVDGLLPAAAQADDPATSAAFFSACGKARNLLAISSFQQAEQTLAKRLHLKTGRAKRVDDRMMAVVQRSPYVEQGGQYTPTTTAGDQIILGMEY